MQSQNDVYTFAIKIRVVTTQGKMEFSSFYIGKTLATINILILMSVLVATTRGSHISEKIELLCGLLTFFTVNEFT